MATEQQLNWIDELPDEILLKIFTKLSQSDLLLSARPVCQRWCRLSKDESLWTKVDLSSLFLGSGPFDKTKNTKGIEALLFDIQDCVEKITFSNIPLKSETYGLHCITAPNSPEFVNLYSLDYSYSSVSPGHLRQALSTYSLITELTLVHTSILLTDVITEVLHLPLLKKLVFHDMHAWEYFLDRPQDFTRSINTFSLTKVPRQCPHLEWLELYTIWADLDDSVIHQFIQCCPLLKRLYFTWSTHLTEAAFENSKNHSSVTHLGLADRQGQGPYLNYVLPHFRNLTSLTVDAFEYRYEVYQEDCLAIGKCCPDLQELIFHVKDFSNDPRNYVFSSLLQSNNFLCSTKLQEIALHCRYLRKFHAPCSKVDDDGFTFLVENCPLLEDINFMRCPHLTTKCLHALSRYSPNIKLVNFQGTFIYLDEAFQTFFTNCVQLRNVNLDRKISDEASNSLSNSFSNSPSLENSSCSGHTHEAISPADHDDLEEEFPFIDINDDQEKNKNLDLSQDCNRLALDLSTDNDLTSSCAIYLPVNANHCHLSTLSVRGANISDDALQHIFSLCPDLSHVDLTECYCLNNKTVQTLSLNCRNLKVLMISAKDYGPCFVSDEALKTLSKYSSHLEELSILYNRNISHKGICSLLGSSDRLRSLSFCVGVNYSCVLPLPDGHWWNSLSKQSAKSLKEATYSRESSEFRIMHLEFFHSRLE